MLARERVGRVPSVLQRLEAHGAGVEHEEPPHESLAETDDFPDHFERNQRAEHARARAAGGSPLTPRVPPRARAGEHGPGPPTPPAPTPSPRARLSVWCPGPPISCRTIWRA